MLKKCNDVKVRADLADAGIYMFTPLCVKLVGHIIQELKLDWYSISNDLLPFFAKNQFKEKKLSAMVDEINARESKPIKK